jgi:tetratricopeptide (TPR) repeat protein
MNALKSIYKMSKETSPDLQLLNIIELNLIIRSKSISMSDIYSIEHGFELENEGDLEGASKIFVKLKRRLKLPHLPSICLGVIFFKQKRFLDAIAEFSSAIKLQSELPKAMHDLEDQLIALHNRALCYFRTGDDLLGLADLEKALKINPDHVIVKDLITHIL